MALPNKAACTACTACVQECRATQPVTLPVVLLQVFQEGTTVKLAATSRQVASVVGELPLGDTAGCQPAATAYFVDAVLAPDPEWKVRLPGRGVDSLVRRSWHDIHPKSACRQLLHCISTRQLPYQLEGALPSQLNWCHGFPELAGPAGGHGGDSQHCPQPRPQRLPPFSRRPSQRCPRRLPPFSRRRPRRLPPFSRRRPRRLPHFSRRRSQRRPWRLSPLAAAAASAASPAAAALAPPAGSLSAEELSEAQLLSQAAAL